MVAKCCVPLCRSGLKGCTKDKEGNKISFFHLPKDDFLFKKWCRLIRRKDKKLGKKSDLVCCLHFTKDDISSSFETKLPDGSIHRIEKERVSLKPGAIPSVFDGFPPHVLSKMKIERKSPKRDQGGCNSDLSRVGVTSSPPSTSLGKSSQKRNQEGCNSIQDVVGVTSLPPSTSPRKSPQKMNQGRCNSILNGVDDTSSPPSTFLGKSPEIGNQGGFNSIPNVVDDTPLPPSTSIDHEASDETLNLRTPSLLSEIDLIIPPNWGQLLLDDSRIFLQVFFGNIKVNITGYSNLKEVTLHSTLKKYTDLFNIVDKMKICPGSFYSIDAPPFKCRGFTGKSLFCVCCTYKLTKNKKSSAGNKQKTSPTSLGKR